MPKCRLLLPPIQLADRLLTEEGAIAHLVGKEAAALAALGVVEILDSDESEPVEVSVTPLTEQQNDEAILAITFMELLTEAELIALPHIGKTIAQKLIKARPLTIDKVKAIAKLTDEQWSEVQAAVNA